MSIAFQSIRRRYQQERVMPLVPDPEAWTRDDVVRHHPNTPDDIARTFDAGDMPVTPARSPSDIARFDEEGEIPITSDPSMPATWQEIIRRVIRLEKMAHEPQDIDSRVQRALREAGIFSPVIATVPREKLVSAGPITPEKLGFPAERFGTAPVDTSGTQAEAIAEAFAQPAPRPDDSTFLRERLFDLSAAVMKARSSQRPEDYEVLLDLGRDTLAYLTGE